MQFTATLLALLATSGIVAALPEAVAGGWKGKGHLTSSCWTKSTCKATSYYSTKTESKPVTVTSVYTKYKTVTKETDVPSVYTSTKYSTSPSPPSPV